MPDLLGTGARLLFSPGRAAPRNRALADARWLDLDAGAGSYEIPFRATRRGTGRIERLWLRWPGRLGLSWKQQVLTFEAATAILPDLSVVHDRGARLFQRHAMDGLMAQIERGDGVDFDALVEFRAGMDRRAIDWKQSGRHRKLHAKEKRTERKATVTVPGGDLTVEWRDDEHVILTGPAEFEFSGELDPATGAWARDKAVA